MNQNDLEKLLGIAPQAAKPVKQATITPVQGTSWTGEVSDQALVLDKWDVRRGKECLERSPHLQGLGLTPEAISDFHAAAFLQEPELVEHCQDERRHGFLKAMLETPEYQALHESTQLNVLASEMAASHFGEEFAKMAREDQKRKEKQGDKPRTPKQQEQDKVRAEMSALRAVGKALQEAGEEVEQLEDTQKALGCGPGQGQDGQLDLDKVREMFKRTRNDGQLRKIIDLAGRFRRVAQAKQRQKVHHGYDDMVDVVVDGDISRLLPHELALLATEETELDAMRRLVERQSMCREYRGVEKVGKGPIVVCVDESGSMYGDPVCQAKAFALAMAWVARHQRRWIMLSGFSGGTTGNHIAMPPGKWDQSALLDWLGHFFGGGTSHHVICEELPHLWTQLTSKGMPAGKTDLIVISDGIIHIPPGVEKSFNDWKIQSKCRAIGILIDQTDGGGLSKILDETHLARSINTDEDSIQRCLSI